MTLTLHVNYELINFSNEKRLTRRQWMRHSWHTHSYFLHESKLGSVFPLRVKVTGESSEKVCVFVC